MWEPYEHAPSFPGGNILQFIQENLHYPEEAAKDSIEGRVVVTFIVETDGSISNIEVVRGIHPLLDKEAIRVMGLMPKWNPAMNNDTPIRVKTSLPVTFKLESTEQKESSRQ
jgi:protein TonB